MFNIDENLQKILFIHILVCACFYNYKPKFMFDDNNNFKAFGTGPNKTIYPFFSRATANVLLLYEAL